ncbi:MULTISPECIES: sensor histidine kinase [Stutzerimonas stutzeri subgroup]|uniref:histidine kinase n=1 Tax=Stutzerimonas stutzeri NF13 TaxID=1212548 RepID=M2UKW7_STUST|nr:MULTISPECIES: ATP-binding protein [Stutzerimonas stutzeri subgroup]EMD99169.1 two-component sensor [Stutzerimonas stutzeri NF13]MBK3882028.1 ATP-binding protein [Stutzerimonas stutzeri]WOF80656.1 ATP-binding protein [Pseudomonas sp. FeN3W]
MKSIQRSLSLALIATLLLVALVLVQTSLWLFESGLRRSLETDLREETEGLLIALVKGPNGDQLDVQRLNPRYQRPFSGHYFKIELPERTWRSRSLWDASPEWPERAGLADELLDGPQEQRLLGYRAEYRRDGQPIIISVAQDYTPVLESFARVRLSGLGLVGFALLALLLLQRYAMGLALRPLERARQQIAQLQQGQRQQLDQRAPVELQPLVEQINHLLSHTEDTLQRSRHALGNLGHALKTPLAVLGSLVQREELAAHPELQASLQEQLAQIQQRVSRELGRARLSVDVLPGAHFDCDAELPALFDTLAMIHRSGLDLRWQAPAGCRLPRDREDMLELLGNLLDNACKWARSRVELSIERSGDGFVLLVDDDGPGIPAAQREQVIDRGVRLDESAEGHGLGLGIVSDILTAWRGEWSLEESPLGGLRVSIALPATR